MSTPVGFTLRLMLLALGAGSFVRIPSIRYLFRVLKSHAIRRP